MVFKKWLLMTFSVLALGIGGFSVSAQGAQQQCASEECACEEALNRNTVEALEEFLRKYPQSVNNKESACAAIAVPPLDEIAPNQKDDDGVTVHPDFNPSEG